jgi:hypothetical protein
VLASVAGPNAVDAEQRRKLRDEVLQKREEMTAYIEDVSMLENQRSKEILLNVLRTAVQLCEVRAPSVCQRRLHHICSLRAKVLHCPAPTALAKAEEATSLLKKLNEGATQFCARAQRCTGTLIERCMLRSLARSLIVASTRDASSIGRKSGAETLSSIWSKSFLLYHRHGHRCRKVRCFVARSKSVYDSMAVLSIMSDEAG